MTLVEQLRSAAIHVANNGGAPCRSNQTLYWIAADKIEELEKELKVLKDVEVWINTPEYGNTTTDPESPDGDHDCRGDQLCQDVINVTGLDEIIVWEMGILELLSFAIQHIFFHKKTGPDVDRIHQAARDIYDNDKLMRTLLHP